MWGPKRCRWEWLWKTLWQVFWHYIKLSMILQCCFYTYTKNNMYMLIAALFTRAKQWKWLVIIRWTDKQAMWCMCNGLLFICWKKYSTNIWSNVRGLWVLGFSRKILPKKCVQRKKENHDYWSERILTGPGGRDLCFRWLAGSLCVFSFLLFCLENKVSQNTLQQGSIMESKDIEAVRVHCQTEDIRGPWWLFGASFYGVQEEHAFSYYGVNWK